MRSFVSHFFRTYVCMYLHTCVFYHAFCRRYFFCLYIVSFILHFFVHVSIHFFVIPIHVIFVYAVQWRRHGGQAGQLAPPGPPPTSDRTPREIDADPRTEKMGVGLQDLLRSFTRTDATADVLWSYDYEKEEVVEVVEGVTLVGPR